MRKGQYNEPNPGRLIYGMNPVAEAVRAGTASTIYISAHRKRHLADLIEDAEAANISVRLIHDPQWFDSRFPKAHQGVAAETTGRTEWELEDLLYIPKERKETALFIILDGIEDPRNLGAILRTAEAAGAHGIVAQERRAAALTPDAVKASAGASEHIPFCIVSNIKNAMRTMREEGIRIVGAENAPDAVSIWDADMSGDIALVVGSEGEGLRRTVAEQCDILVRLPLRGKVGSLNASVACGVAVFEIIRQNERLRENRGIKPK